MVQALGNLIGNAIKFTPAGGAVRVRADREPAGDALRFTVEDTGQGISPHVQPHIFDRAWNARQRRADGHGLGLSIVRGIVEGHGGRLELASSLGAGSAFSFTIPLDAAAPPVPAAEPGPRP